MEMDHKRCKIGPKNTSNFNRSSHSYVRTISSFLAYFAFLQRAPSNQEEGWFNSLFQAKKNKQFLIKKWLFFADFF